MNEYIDKIIGWSESNTVIGHLDTKTVRRTIQNNKAPEELKVQRRFSWLHETCVQYSVELPSYTRGKFVAAKSYVRLWIL